jgi:hypothetical protein
LFSPERRLAPIALQSEVIVKRIFALSCLVAVMALTLSLSITPATAQGAERTWLSGGAGDDANPCSRTAPCKTFAGAISKTNAGGEINCIDPGGFGTLTITKSITIDCRDVYASVLNDSVSGIPINFNSFTDSAKLVNLRGISFNAASTSLNGINIIGTTNAAGSKVTIEDCVFSGQGTAIDDGRTSGSLLVGSSTIRNSVTGISGGSSAAGSLSAVLDRVRVLNSTTGISALAGSNFMITDSVMSNTTTAVSSAASSLVLIDTGTVSGNTIGIQIAAGGLVRLSNSNMFQNVTAFSGSGTLQSHSNNRFFGNGGSLPTPFGTPNAASGLF